MVKKNDLFITIEDMDLRKTGGPFIPRRTQGNVVTKRRDGRIWVYIKGFGYRHLYQEDVERRQTKAECLKEMAGYIANEHNHATYRVRYCRDAKEYVVQVLQSCGEWLCLHND